MSKTLLVELGCEEIPARMVAGLAQQFADNLERHLKVAGLGSETPTVHWTPRRLIYLQDGVLEVQPAGEEQIVGPPARIAFAADGSPTASALGFAAKNGAAEGELFRLTTAKGDYVALKKKTGGGDALALLAELIPKAFHEVQLPRSMRWSGGLRFIRPLRWLLGVYGEMLVPFQLGELHSGPESRGHRTLGAPRFAVKSAADYPGLWQANAVVPDPGERRKRIGAAAARLQARRDVELEDTLVNLTEHPDVVVGDFDPAYLKSLPAEVLVTVMRDHQKYFAVEDGDGQLAPRFVTVINQAGDPQGLIRHGNERVLKARFSDAQFFWQADCKLSLGGRLPLLEQVTFQVKLGSYREKSLRIRTLGVELARRWRACKDGCDENVAAIAAELAKCDLTTDMVKEFPELQGIMGGHYARAEGQPEAVAQAIADQYAWDAPPRTNEGAAVSVADKLDTIGGMFSIGEIPSGSADPFGLRRQANGVMRTLIERELPLNLTELMKPSPELAAFLKERLSFYLREVGGFSPETVGAVLAASSDDPLDAFRRCQAVSAAPDMAAVAAVLKRAGNIVRKEKWSATTVNPERLGAPAELALFQAVNAIPAGEEYGAELAAISGLAGPLERFFAEVRVNDDDAAVRANRLSLLAWTVQQLSRTADFRESSARTD